MDKISGFLLASISVLDFRQFASFVSLFNMSCETNKWKKHRGVGGRVTLGVYESLNRMISASSMSWYGHVVKREDKNGMVKALEF